MDVKSTTGFLIIAGLLYIIYNSYFFVVPYLDCYSGGVKISTT